MCADTHLLVFKFYKNINNKILEGVSYSKVDVQHNRFNLSQKKVSRKKCLRQSHQKIKLNLADGCSSSEGVFLINFRDTGILCFLPLLFLFFLA